MEAVILLDKINSKALHDRVYENEVVMRNSTIRRSIVDKQVIEDYDNQFEVFESEVEYGFKNICLHYAINILTVNRQAPINKTPEFWKFTLYNLATVSILTLGRIFDIQANFNIHKLFNILGQNLDILSLAELKTRKGPTIDFEEYIKDKVDFSNGMYRDLVKLKKAFNKQYNKPYKAYRDSIIGHRLVKNTVEIEDGEEFQYMDILNIYIGLHNIKWELWERYYNGRGATNLTFEELTLQIHSLENNERNIPRYLYMARDYLKIYYLLEQCG